MDGGTGQMTLQEIEDSIKAQINGHKLVHTRFEFLDVNASLLLEAMEQIKRTVMLIEAGIEDAKDHRAEAYLLMVLEQAWHHGYTPKEKKP